MTFRFGKINPRTGHRDVFRHGGQQRQPRPITLAARNLPPHVEEAECWRCTRCRVAYYPEEENAVEGSCPRCGHPSKPVQQESDR